jgi:hypothetical protein
MRDRRLGGGEKRVLVAGWRLRFRLGARCISVPARLALAWLRFEIGMTERWGWPFASLTYLRRMLHKCSGGSGWRTSQ